MKFSFSHLDFEVINDRIRLVKFLPFLSSIENEKTNFCYFPEIRITGDNNMNRFSAQQFGAMGRELKYVTHDIRDNKLMIIQSDSDIEVETIFEKYTDTNAIRTYSTVKNTSKNPIVLEYISAMNFYGLSTMSNTKNMGMHRFYSSNYNECQPVYNKFDQLGFSEGIRSSKRLSGVNIGSWSTKEELPQIIIDFEQSQKFLMVQIESNNSWFWELGEHFGNIFFNAGIGNSVHTNWYKTIEPKEKYSTIKSAFCYGDSLNSVIEQITFYRRNIVRKCEPDKDLPVIFNEYMHLSWDSPNEERTKKLVPHVASFGVDYYVIDCGWHNEEPGDKIYPYVGQWKESKSRFPSGIKHIIDYIHLHGMKAGLWIEPEIVGRLCQEMLDYYPDDAFITRDGIRLLTANRYFLDFRNKTVTDYLNQVIDYLVECGVDYIKMDYNQDMGAGTDYQSTSLGDGLEQHASAYLRWVIQIMDKYPKLVIETCSSGGHRMDYRTMSIFPIVSSSDQIDYLKYPYISSNILSGILPEQAAVWSYPVQAFEDIHNKTDEIDSKVDEDTVVMNMINSFLGRMHLASYINHLNDAKKQLIKEGILYYKELSKIKRKSIPYFPSGFWNFKNKHLFSGLVFEDKLYLAVWNMGNDDGKVIIPITEYKVKSAEIVYPRETQNVIKVNDNCVTINLRKKQSRFLEIKVS